MKEFALLLNRDNDDSSVFNINQSKQYDWRDRKLTKKNIA